MVESESLWVSSNIRVERQNYFLSCCQRRSGGRVWTLQVSFELLVRGYWLNYTDAPTLYILEIKEGKIKRKIMLKYKRNRNINFDILLHLLKKCTFQIADKHFISRSVYLWTLERTSYWIMNFLNFYFELFFKLKFKILC